MKDMIPKGTGNSRFLRSVSNFKTIYPTYDDFVNALMAGDLPVDFNGINEAGIQQVGTSLNKANLLTDETATALGLTSTDPTVNEAFGRLNQHLTDVEADGVKIEVGSYVGTNKYGESNPNSLTFSFVPKLFMIAGYTYNTGAYAVLGVQYILPAFILGNEYTKFSGNLNQGAKIVGNTLYWYGNSASVQCNTSNTYHYIAIG